MTDDSNKKLEDMAKQAYEEQKRLRHINDSNQYYGKIKRAAIIYNPGNSIKKEIKSYGLKYYFPSSN